MKTSYFFGENNLKSFFRPGWKGMGDPGVEEVETRVYVKPERGCRAVYLPVSYTHLDVYKRQGGSIPIISTFEQVLGIKTVLMGFGLEQNAIHSPNESCTLDFFYKGIESVAEFYKRFN